MRSASRSAPAPQPIASNQAMGEHQLASGLADRCIELRAELAAARRALVDLAAVVASQQAQLDLMQQLLSRGSR